MDEGLVVPGGDIIKRVAAADTQNVFRHPVDVVAIPQYLAVIEHPIDLSSIATKVLLRRGDALHDEIADDLNRMFCNCAKFNGLDAFFTPYAMNIRNQFRHVFVVLPESADDVVLAAALFHDFSTSFEPIMKRAAETEPLRSLTESLGSGVWSGTVSSRSVLRELQWLVTIVEAAHGEEVGCSSARRWVQGISIPCVSPEPSANAVVVAAICELERIAEGGDCVLPDLERDDLGGSSLSVLKCSVEDPSRIASALDDLLDTVISLYGPGSTRAAMATRLRAAAADVVTSLTE